MENNVSREVKHKLLIDDPTYLKSEQRKFLESHEDVYEGMNDRRKGFVLTVLNGLTSEDLSVVERHYHTVLKGKSAEEKLTVLDYAKRATDCWRLETSFQLLAVCLELLANISQPERGHSV